VQKAGEQNKDRKKLFLTSRASLLLIKEQYRLCEGKEKYAGNRKRKSRSNQKLRLFLCSGGIGIEKKMGLSK